MRGNTSVFWIAAFLISIAISYFIVRGQASRASRAELDVSRLREELTALQQALAAEKKESEGQIKYRDARIEGLSKILEERKVQFPWLASAIADFNALDAARDAKYLETKKHPAAKSAELVRLHAQKQREAEKQRRILRYRVEYYENLFPWIADYVGDDVPDDHVDVSGLVHDPVDDPALNWIPRAEYERLSTAERYQKALDNWRKRRKSNWEIGREYERYVGYLYETMGYDVEYTGAIQGFEDMGRDVIARRDGVVAVIQCKFWASAKEIREKHIFQLFGSSLEYAFRLGTFRAGDQLALFGNTVEAAGVTPILYTSTRLSDVARDVADKLGVKYFEEAKISDYPLIKCNVSSRDGERIYHLPFDQQYDRVKLCNPSERYVYTAVEAEQAGFRRAWRWHDSNH